MVCTSRDGGTPRLGNAPAPINNAYNANLWRAKLEAIAVLRRGVPPSLLVHTTVTNYTTSTIIVLSHPTNTKNLKPSDQ